MALTLEDLKGGVLLLCRKFEDGSTALFRATASETFLKENRLAPNRIYNLDTMTVIDEKVILDGSCEIVNENYKDTKMSLLDRYMNRGVAGECFKSR